MRKCNGKARVKNDAEAKGRMNGREKENKRVREHTNERKDE